MSAAVCWVPQGEAQCRPVGVPQGEAQYRPVGTSKGEALSCQGPFPAASPFVALPAESAVVPEVAFPVASSVVALPVESAVVPEVAPPVASPVVALPTNLKALVTYFRGHCLTTRAGWIPQPTLGDYHPCEFGFDPWRIPSM